jgi:hypothetical protein
VILEFGQEKEREEEKVDKKSLLVLDDGHFISSGLDLKQADITGFNTIVPKSNAQTLVTTSQGYPIVTTWRYGLGRVISLTTDDGKDWAGGLLSKDNSVLLTRIAAYAVGNPKRKEEFYIEIPDTIVGEQSDVIVKTNQYPDQDTLGIPIDEGLNFNMVEPNLYIASFVPDKTGINSLLGRDFGVNYEREYQEVGLNPMLSSFVIRTGGLTFQPNDIDGMVEDARSRAQKLQTKKVYFRWIFILIAIAVLLIELVIRRILSNQRKI